MTEPVRGSDGPAPVPGEDGSALTAEVRALVDVSAALSSRDPTALRGALERADAVAAAARIEEVLLQSYLFLGFPAALGAFALWRKVSERDAPDDAWRDGDDRARWRERGERVCRTVYGDQYDALRANVRGLHPDLDRWMVEEGYGKVLGRPEPDLPVRELCIAALLAVLDAPVQLYSHLRGALNAGASPGEVEAALEVARRHMSDDARKSARETWERVRQRAGR